ncbi:hypothetical protein ACERZ8_12870 [Tateyamaria armeniaca]|uniref:Response regulatory domain-containing protein n=1 Tax=Tateyamaria armeniaca TaxID=2518930 RepID=A0ABW8UUF1_9RHOB
MQALIIDTQAARLDHSLMALMEAGIHVTGTGSLLVAETCISRLGVDLLVMDKTTVGDALGDTLGMAEDRNPHLVSILRTSDVAADQDELSPHFPSLHCVVGQDVSNEVAVKLGLASLRAQVARAVSSPRTVPFVRSRFAGLKTPMMARAATPVSTLAEAV